MILTAQLSFVLMLQGGPPTIVISYKWSYHPYKYRVFVHPSYPIHFRPGKGAPCPSIYNDGLSWGPPCSYGYNESVFI